MKKFVSVVATVALVLWGASCTSMNQNTNIVGGGGGGYYAPAAARSNCGPSRAQAMGTQTSAAPVVVSHQVDASVKVRKFFSPNTVNVYVNRGGGGYGRSPQSYRPQSPCPPQGYRPQPGCPPPGYGQRPPQMGRPCPPQGYRPPYGQPQYGPHQGGQHPGSSPYRGLLDNQGRLIR
jgi:hypothetical protein